MHAQEKKKLLRPRMVAQLYDIPEGYQAKMRCSGEGPEYIKLGSKIYYEESSIERWLITKRRTSTSDKGEALPASPTAPGRQASQEARRRIR